MRFAIYALKNPVKVSRALDETIVDAVDLARPSRARRHRYGEREIDITVRDGRYNIDTRKITVSVIDCPGKPALAINSSKSDRAADEIEFSIIGKRGIETPCTYEWDFGDGFFINTGEETITHDYGKRPQDALSSTFTVTVRAIDGKGNKAAARTSISLVNTRFVSKQVGFAVVPVMYDTGLQLVDHAWSTRVIIKNIYDAPITFTEAEIIKKSMPGSEIIERQRVSAGSIMNTLEIRNGEIAEDAITLPSHLVPDPGQVTQVVLMGTFPDKTTAKGILFLFKE